MHVMPSKEAFIDRQKQFSFKSYEPCIVTSRVKSFARPRACVEFKHGQEIKLSSKESLKRILFECTSVSRYIVTSISTFKSCYHGEIM